MSRRIIQEEVKVRQLDAVANVRAHQ